MGPERSGDLVAVRRRDRPASHVWLDLGETVRVVDDPTDAGDALHLDVMKHSMVPKLESALG